jgi:tetratricopeptide (TPR) repeat protein
MTEPASSHEVNLAEISAQIVDTFDDTEQFRKFLRESFAINASRHVGNVGTEEMVDFYIGRFIQEGRIDKLIKRMAEVYPRKPGLKQLAGKYADTPLERFLEATGYSQVLDSKRRKPQNLPFLSLGSLFKGRDQYLLELHQTLSKRRNGHAAPVAIQALHGLGGVGKTRTAIEYAWTYFAEYSALFYVFADSPANLRSHLAALSGPGVLNLPEANQEKEEIRLGVVLRWLQERSGWLLILDNVDTPEAAAAVEQVLPQLRNGSVLITSRLTEWGGGVEPLELGVLDRQAAAAFLLERTAGKRRALPTDAADAADAAALADDLGCLALALEQAGAFLVKHHGSLADYRQRWRQQEKKVLEWFDARTMNYHHSVSTTWQTSFAELSPDGRALLQVLAWLAPDPIPRGMPQRLKPSEDGVAIDVELALADLTTYSLIRWEQGAETFSIHRLVQEITRYSIAKEDRSGWLGRALQMVDDFVEGDPNDVRGWASVYDPARPHMAAIVQHADDSSHGVIASRLMKDFGRYLVAKALWQEAEPLYRRALAIYEAALGPDHSDVASVLNNLAELLDDTNRWKEAEPLIRRALAISEASFGPHAPYVATDLNNLAKILEHTNRRGEAEPLFRRALAIYEVAYGPDHPDVAATLNNLALLLTNTYRRAEAEPLYRRALAIREAALGPDHPDVAISLDHLAGLLRHTNRHQEAEPLYRRALAIFEAAYGPHHPRVASPLNNLASLLRDTNRRGEAEPLYRRALAIYEAAYGPHHPLAAIALGNLSRLLERMYRGREAEPLYRRALAIYEVAYGPHHPDVATTLNNLASLLTDTNRRAEAETLYRRALAIDEAALGPDHPDVATTLNNLASLLTDTNRRAEAETLYRRALTIREAALGPDHPDVSTVLLDLARLLEVTKGWGEAEPLFRRALVILVRFRIQSGHQHPIFKAYSEYYRISLRSRGVSDDEIKQRLEAIDALAREVG